MSEAKFTKGEWIVYDGDLRYCKGKVCIIESDDMPTVIADLNDYFGKESRAANAHLIAAAPRMYEALERLSRFSCDESIGDGNLWDIRELLAKARGE